MPGILSYEISDQIRKPLTESCQSCQFIISKSIGVRHPNYFLRVSVDTSCEPHNWCTTEVLFGVTGPDILFPSPTPMLTIHNSPTAASNDNTIQQYEWGTAINPQFSTEWKQIIAHKIVNGCNTYPRAEHTRGHLENANLP